MIRIYIKRTKELPAIFPSEYFRLLNLHILETISENTFILVNKLIQMVRKYCHG